MIEDFNNCILVGNGPSLLTKTNGKFIDSYEKVIRINKFRTVGFEPYVGEKTDVWVTFGRGTNIPENEKKPNTIIYIHGNSGNPSYIPAKLYRIPLTFYYKIQDKIKEKSKLKNTNALLPSSGILTMEWLLSNIDHVTITGIDFFDKTLSAAHHYWDIRSFTKPKEHDGDSEYEIVSEYIKNRRVTIL